MTKLDYLYEKFDKLEDQIGPLVEYRELLEAAMEQPLSEELKTKIQTALDDSEDYYYSLLRSYGALEDEIYDEIDRQFFDNQALQFRKVFIEN